MWEISLSGQVSATLWSVPVGILLCVLYDLIRALRRKLRIGFLTAVLLDVLFFILCGFTAFCIFLIFCAGQVRFYVFLGLLAGFLLCRFTVSHFLVMLFSLLIGLFCTVFSKACELFQWVFSYFQKIFGKIADFGRNIAKKLLQPVCRLLYNLKRNRANHQPDESPASK